MNIQEIIESLRYLTDLIEEANISQRLSDEEKRVQIIGYLSDIRNLAEKNLNIMTLIPKGGKK